MLGTITPELFPNECQVIEIIPDTQYVYPIFKNGSSSLGKSGYPLISNQQLSTIKNVEVYVREPHDRFVSGVQTYLSKLDSKADIKTALYFIEKYLYLNRHFCPQIFWLMNLRRFTNASITIKPIESINQITNFNINQSNRDLDLVKYFEQKSKVRFYNEIDEVLTINLLGKTVEFDEITELLKENYSELYFEIFTRCRNIIDVVS